MRARRESPDDVGVVVVVVAGVVRRGWVRDDVFVVFLASSGWVAAPCSSA